MANAEEKRLWTEAKEMFPNDRKKQRNYVYSTLWKRKRERKRAEMLDSERI